MANLAKLQERERHSLVVDAKEFSLTNGSPSISFVETLSERGKSKPYQLEVYFEHTGEKYFLSKTGSNDEKSIKDLAYHITRALDERNITGEVILDLRASPTKPLSSANIAFFLLGELAKDADRKYKPMYVSL